MPLRGTTPTPEDKKRLKILIYGPSGVGKTTSAIQLPNNYIIDMEKGTVAYSDEIKAMNSVVFHTTNPYELEKEVDALLAEKHNFRTLTIDPITTLWINLQAYWDSRFQDAVGKEDGLQDWGMRYWTKVKKDYKRIRNKLLALDMNVLVIVHQKDKYQGQNVVGITFDSEKEDDYSFDFVFRLIKRSGKYIALTEKQRVSLGGKRFPDEFEWKYDNLVKFYGEDIFIRPSNNVDNKNINEVDIKVDEKDQLADKLELLKIKLKENNINVNDFKSFLKNVANWDLSAVSKISLQQVTTLLDNWTKEIIPRFNTFMENTKAETLEVTPEVVPEVKPEVKEEKSEDKQKKAKTKKDAIETINLLLEEWQIDSGAFTKHLNIKKLNDLDLNGLNSIIDNFDTIRETIS